LLNSLNSPRLTNRAPKGYKVGLGELYR